MAGLGGFWRVSAGSAFSAVMYRIVSDSKARGSMDGREARVSRAHIIIELLDARPAESDRFGSKCER
eukprot:COSAG02_NODE_35064_length_474_cov_0.946667_1_plen_67_part_00